MKNVWKRCGKSRKRNQLVIGNEDMNEIIKIINPLENPVVLIDGVSETVKHEIKKKNVDFLVCYWKCFVLQC